MSSVARSAARTTFAILALSGLLGAGAAFAAGEVGSINFTLGAKRLTSDWDLGAPEATADGDSVLSRAGQAALGVELTWGREGWPVMVALDVLHSYDDGLERFPAINLGTLIIPPADVRRRASTLEIGLGARRSFPTKAFTPYIGAGGSFVRGNVLREMSDPSQGTYGALVASSHDEDAGFGYWVGGGLYRRLGPRMQIGLAGRYSKATLSIPEMKVVGEQGGYLMVPGDRTDIEAGGTHFAVIAGWSFPARK
jgi:opacity protein-like surface antigen